MLQFFSDETRADELRKIGANMTPEHVSNIRKLSEFLKGLRDDQFDITVLAVFPVKSPNEKRTPMRACAIGWLPAIFPGVSWDPGSSGSLYTRFVPHLDHYFGLTGEIGGCLFSAGMQRQLSPELPELNSYAKPTEMANMLEQFLRLVGH